MGLTRPHKPTNGFSPRWVFLFCIASFFLGIFVVDRFWAVPDPVETDEDASLDKVQSKTSHPIVNCEKKEGSFQADILSQVSQTHDVIMTLDKTISSLEVQLAAARASKADNDEGSPMVTEPGAKILKERPKVFFVMGIITAFSSRKRRDSIRETWMPQGEELRKLEVEKGIIIRFVIGHSATPGGVLDRAVDAEEAQHKDFLRLRKSFLAMPKGKKKNMEELIGSVEGLLEAVLHEMRKGFMQGNSIRSQAKRTSGCSL